MTGLKFTIILTVLTFQACLVWHTSVGQTREDSPAQTSAAAAASSSGHMRALILSQSQLAPIRTRRALILPSSARGVAKSSARTLDLLFIKALLLGPIIGLTLKAAFVRGLVWAVLAYGAHLFFPSLLSGLGLGSGLVGFARQLRPDYSHVLATYLSQLRLPTPGSFNQMARQYQQVLSPVVDSIRAIPEGHCRFRAVCETASHLARQARSMSSSLQRISATMYMNFGTDYSKAWLDGVVQSDCAAKYNQCLVSPFSMVAARLAPAAFGPIAVDACTRR